MLMLLTGCSVAFACYEERDSVQCCAGQTPAFVNGCVRKTCEGGNRNDKICFDLGSGVDYGWVDCSTTSVNVTKTVVQYPLSGTICNLGATPTQLDDESSPCTNTILDGSCDGSE